jgi:hypothetical protein
MSDIQDIINWVRSELRMEERPKMGKHVFNHDKIAFMKKLIRKLESIRNKNELQNLKNYGKDKELKNPSSPRL